MRNGLFAFLFGQDGGNTVTHSCSAATMELTFPAKIKAGILRQGLDWIDFKEIVHDIMQEMIILTTYGGNNRAIRANHKVISSVLIEKVLGDSNSASRAVSYDLKAERRNEYLVTHKSELGQMQMLFTSYVKRANEEGNVDWEELRMQVRESCHAIIVLAHRATQDAKWAGILALLHEIYEGAENIRHEDSEKIRVLMEHVFSSAPSGA